MGGQAFGHSHRCPHRHHVALVCEHREVDSGVDRGVGRSQPHRAARADLHHRGDQHTEPGHLGIGLVEGEYLQVVPFGEGGPQEHRRDDLVGAQPVLLAQPQGDGEGGVVLQTDTHAGQVHTAAQQHGRRVDGPSTDDHRVCLDLGSVGEPHPAGPATVEQDPVNQGITPDRQVRSPANGLEVDPVHRGAGAVGEAGQHGRFGTGVGCQEGPTQPTPLLGGGRGQGYGEAGEPGLDVAPGPARAPMVALPGVVVGGLAGQGDHRVHRRRATHSAPPPVGARIAARDERGRQVVPRPTLLGQCLVK